MVGGRSDPHALRHGIARPGPDDTAARRRRRRLRPVRAPDRAVVRRGRPRPAILRPRPRRRRGRGAAPPVPVARRARHRRRVRRPGRVLRHRPAHRPHHHGRPRLRRRRGLPRLPRGVAARPRGGRRPRSRDGNGRLATIAGTVLLVLAIGTVLPFGMARSAAGHGAAPSCRSSASAWRGSPSGGWLPVSIPPHRARATSCGAPASASRSSRSAASSPSAGPGRRPPAAASSSRPSSSCAGLWLVAGAFLGGARWLILPALALALPAGVVVGREPRRRRRRRATASTARRSPPSMRDTLQARRRPPRARPARRAAAARRPPPPRRARRGRGLDRRPARRVRDERGARRRRPGRPCSTTARAASTSTGATTAARRPGTTRLIVDGDVGVGRPRRLLRRPDERAHRPRRSVADRQRGNAACIGGVRG